MEDETKEVVHVGFETYKRIVDLSGGWTLFVIIALLQLAGEYFNLSAQSTKNEWASKDEKDQKLFSGYFMRVIFLLASL